MDQNNSKNNSKRERLKAAGWCTGTVQEMLDLSQEETQLVETESNNLLWNSFPWYSRFFYSFGRFLSRIFPSFALLTRMMFLIEVRNRLELNNKNLTDIDELCMSAFMDYTKFKILNQVKGNSNDSII